MIRVEGVQARYSRHEAMVLDGLDLQVPEGSLFGLLGPNGAGKTTLVHILLGLLTPECGRVAVEGLEIPGQSRQLAGRVGLAPQSLAFYPSLTVRDNLAFFERMRPDDRRQRGSRIETALQRTGLAAQAGRRAGRLSGGLKQRLNLAIALLGEPPLLLLDEPTVGVDTQSRRFILDTLQALNDHGVTILYTTHYMDEVQRLCDRVAIMDAGQILIADTLPALLCDAPDLETLFLRLTGSALRH